MGSWIAEVRVRAIGAVGLAGVVIIVSRVKVGGAVGVIGVELPKAPATYYPCCIRN